MALGAVPEQVEHLQARYRHLEAGVLEFPGIAHGVNYNAPFAPTRFSMRILAPIVAATLLLSGCVYKIDIQQGNYVPQDVAAKLKTGMTKSEVRLLLGTPLLVDPFHSNRWDYYFSNVKGRKAEDSTRLTVFFENDKVVNFVGEARPSAPPPVGATKPPAPAVAPAPAATAAPAATPAPAVTPAPAAK
jgi:outer membrane protein assembly factor BamE